MRSVHLAGRSGPDRLVPLCGSWGGMDSHWTDDPAAVTCARCREVLARAATSTRAAGAPLV
jgi:hypothetical protein